ncbi:hypothetical protein ON010_g16420 [Phytophthora cinnamomi]|nr:hypothetical protein ON010_g16420 [Phytophthora cinnamomi]
MAASNRKVLLLVDNASCHKILRNLTHVTVHFLPPNMTSVVQPLDAGKYFISIVVVQGSVPKLNVLAAVQFSIDAWAGVTPTTITNCWVKTRILGGTMLGRVRAYTNYIEAVSGNEMEELTAILSKWEGAVSASEYLAVDEDVPAHEPDVIVDEAAGSDAVSQDESEEEEEEEEEDQEPTIQPAIALRHCMELSAFLLQCGEQTDRERRALQTVTALVRETTRCSMRLHLCTGMVMDCDAGARWVEAFLDEADEDEAAFMTAIERTPRVYPAEISMPLNTTLFVAATWSKEFVQRTKARPQAPQESTSGLTLPRAEVELAVRDRDVHRAPISVDLMWPGMSSAPPQIKPSKTRAQIAVPRQVLPTVAFIRVAEKLPTQSQKTKKRFALLVPRLRNDAVERALHVSPSTPTDQVIFLSTGWPCRPSRGKAPAAAISGVNAEKNIIPP